MRKAVLYLANKLEACLRKFYQLLTPDVLLIVIFVLSFAVRFAPVLSYSFPVNDGGFIYSMVNDIRSNHFFLPRFSSYNQALIPFAYPPLTLFLAAFLSSLGLPLLTILRFLPPLVSVITVLLFYKFASLFSKSRTAGLVAAFAFALVPKSYIMIIMGGGLTRSFGLLFCLTSLIFAYRFFTRPSLFRLLLTSASFALTVLSHPEWSFTALVTLLLLGLYLCPRRYRLKSFLSFFSLSFIFCLPWIIFLSSNFGITPLNSAFRSGFWTTTGLLPFLPFSTTSEPILPLFAITSLLGAAYLVFRGSFFLPLWIVISFITNPRTAGQSSIIPLCLTIGFTFDKYLIPRLKLPFVFPYLKTSLALMVLLIPYLTAVFLFPPNFVSLSPDVISAMEWTGQHTPADAKFLVLSPETFTLWSYDRTAEWFPALSQRTSLSTSQGLEWLPDSQFSSRIKALNNLKPCPSQGLTCLENWAGNQKFKYSHIFISDRDSTCCMLLVKELDSSPIYTRIFLNPEVSIWLNNQPNSQP